MAIPRGRIAIDFNTGNADQRTDRVEKIVKKWGGYVDSSRKNIHDGSSVYWYGGSSGPIRITLPPLVSTAGLVWFGINNESEIGVTLGPKDTYTRFIYRGSEFCIDPYTEHQPVGWVYHWAGAYECYSYSNKSYIYYQSFGANTFIINRCAYADPKRMGTVVAIVTKGVHLGTGKASVLVLQPWEHHSDRNWDKFHFWIWNPLINNWITGSISGIQQSMVDSSHLLITPVELNGYSFPEVFFADGTSNSAFIAYCSPDQLREYKYAIKKIHLLDHDYYIPICCSNKTVILLKNKPDDITNLQD